MTKTSGATQAEKLPPPVLGSYDDPSSPIASTTLTRRKVNTLTPSYTTDVKKTPTREEGILLTRILDQAFVDENTCLPQPSSRLSRRSSHLTEDSTTSLTGASAGRSAGVVATLFSPVLRFFETTAAAAPRVEMVNSSCETSSLLLCQGNVRLNHYLC